ncbi:type VI secretion system-associated FHA domain protein TagH [Pseudomonas putida]|uniref:Phosphopeptide-binding protein n=1 Tax=Pseudomonas putida TaxID=303 RepID=A0A177SVU6_PSEPU|nr:type VI secretion system-associated FHA domain protein TagH [Pseudomonas putida]OAI95132.1 phosphopeptide-binding protein [Pseudomonas putida]
MTLDNANRRLLLVVDNPQVLQQGSTPRHLFDAKGGSIGSQHASWTLSDRHAAVKPRHCEVRYRDGGFMVIDRCGETRVNDQTQPLGTGIGGKLSDGDTLHIGPYQISVHLGSDLCEADDPDSHGAALGQVSGEFMTALPEAAPQEFAGEPHQPAGLAGFQALGERPGPDGLLDPLKALDVASGGPPDSLDSHHYGHTPMAAQADVATTRSEAVYGNPMHAPGEIFMPQQDNQHPAAQDWIQRQFSGQAQPAGLVEPLLDGIGATVGTVDELDAYALLNEAGRTLGALIRGLAALNVPVADDRQRISLAGRTLQPIEDNPLRLGQGYPETVRALFAAERSVVHLSPSAAVEESLEQIRRQQIAMHQAISAGLAALLQAFSPEQLEQRFQRYRPARGGQAATADWAWHMYGHYYEELKSGRQQGFDKLFWEVFEQAFDQALRAEA